MQSNAEKKRMTPKKRRRLETGRSIGTYNKQLNISHLESFFKMWASQNIMLKPMHSNTRTVTYSIYMLYAFRCLHFTLLMFTHVTGQLYFQWFSWLQASVVSVITIYNILSDFTTYRGPLHLQRYNKEFDCVWCRYDT